MKNKNQLFIDDERNVKTINQNAYFEIPKNANQSNKALVSSLPLSNISDKQGKIVFCGGGSGGHVTPNIALIDYIHTNNKNIQLYYVGTNSIEKTLISSLDYVKFYEISAKKLIRSVSLTAILNNISLPFALVKSIFECKKILKEIRPDVIFVKGGYVCVPVAIAGKQLNIKVIAHESDITLGLTHKVCKNCYDKLFSTFDIDEKNIISIGSPIRQQIYLGDINKGKKIANFFDKKPVLLVLGGSLGASVFNEFVEKNIVALTNHFNVLHICGKGKKTNIVNDHYRQMEYCKDIFDLYKISSLCLTRGGSNVLCELSTIKLPFICVPLSKSSRGEQTRNAHYFTDKGVGVTLQEDNLNIDSFMIAYHHLFNNLPAFNYACDKIKIDATIPLSNTLLDYCRISDKK